MVQMWRGEWCGADVEGVAVQKWREWCGAGMDGMVVQMIGSAVAYEGVLVWKCAWSNNIQRSRS